MDGEQFYEEFKSALDYLGVGFRGKEEALMWAEGNKLWMEFESRSISVAMPKPKEVKNDNQG